MKFVDLVSTDLENKAAWKECFKVSGVKLPTGYYFGVSATTGDLSDNHDILSIRLFQLDIPDDVSSTTLYIDSIFAPFYFTIIAKFG